MAQHRAALTLGLILLAPLGCERTPAPAGSVSATDARALATTDTARERFVRDSIFLHQKEWHRDLAADAPNPLPGPDSSWIARFDGLNELRVGQTIDELRTRWGDDLVFAGDSGGCDYAFLRRTPAGVALMIEDARLVRIDIDSSLVATAAGIRVGDTESDVRRVYGSLVQQRPDPYSGPEWHYLVVTPAPDSTFRIIFATNGIRVLNYRVGFRGQVDYIEGCS